MVKRDADELAKAQMQIAKQALTDKDYDESVNALKRANIGPVHNLFHGGK